MDFTSLHNRPEARYPAIATMTSAGGGVTPVGIESGFWPAWTPDGSRLVYAFPNPNYCDPVSGCFPDSLGIVNADGSGSELFREVGSHPAWTGWTQPLRPIVGVTSAYNGLDWLFDGTASQDPNGTVVGHAWDFGDGTTGSGATAGHTYAAAGTYTVTLVVTEDDGLTSSSCTTNAAGQCIVSRSFSNSTRTVTFSVGPVSHPTKTYVPSQNHDPDGDSTGTSIVLRRH